MADFTVAAGQARVRSRWPGTPRTSRRRRRSTPAAAIARDRGLVARLVGPLHLPGRVARGRRPLADHAQGADLRADRRHRRRADHLAARAARRRAQLGLPLLLAPRRHVHPATPCSTPATATRPAPGATGCCARWPATRRRLQIMYGLAGERRLTELELPLAARLRGLDARCASATRPASSSSSTSTARCSTRCTRPRELGLEPERGRLAAGAGAAGLPRRRPGDRARRGDLGGARAAAALHPLEGHGLGGVRPGVKSVEDFGLRRPGRPLAAAPRRDPRAGLPRGVRRRAWTRSSSPTARRSSTPAC